MGVAALESTVFQKYTDKILPFWSNILSANCPRGSLGVFWRWHRIISVELQRLGTRRLVFTK